MFEGNEGCDAERLGSHSVSKYLLWDRDLLLLDSGTSHTQLDTGRQEDEIEGKALSNCFDRLWAFAYIYVP